VSPKDIRIFILNASVISVTQLCSMKISDKKWIQNKKRHQSQPNGVTPIYSQPPRFPEADAERVRVAALALALAAPAIPTEKPITTLIRLYIYLFPYISSIPRVGRESRPSTMAIGITISTKSMQSVTAVYKVRCPKMKNSVTFSVG